MLLAAAFSLATFALQRDRVYVVVTAVVLGLLLASLAGSRATARRLPRFRQRC